MTERVLGPKDSPRRRKALLLPAIVVLAAAVVFGVTAAVGASLPGSNFEIDDDANLVVNTAGKIDWASIAHTGTNPPERRRNDAPTGRDDDSYAGGSKEDDTCPGTTTGSIPNNKSDLLAFGVYEEPGTPGFLHLFWQRVLEPSGTTLMDFELNQNGADCGNGVNRVRTIDDLLIEYKIEQGGASATIVVRKWTGSAWGPEVDVTAQGDAVGTINTTPITLANSDGLGAMAARTFGEASIDLDFIFDENKCTSFGSAFLKSRASDSFTSQMKDYIAPQPIELTNCGKVIIRKQTNPDGAAGSFGFTKAFTTDPSTANTFNLSDNGVQTFNNVLFGTGYTVEETSLEPGFELQGIDCSASTGVDVSGGISGAKVTFAIDDEDDILDCTYTNQALGNIKLVKNTFGGNDTFAFTHTIAGLDSSLTTVGGTANDTSSAIAAGSNYAISENTPPAGWDFTSAECKLADNITVTGTVSNRSITGITVEAGKTTTCTFTNTKRGNILVDKVAVGGNGTLFEFDPSYSSTNFSLADATTPNDSGALAPGTYSVAEVNIPAGWDLTNTSCDDGSAVTAISLQAGETITCTFTNTKRARVNILKLDDQSPPAALNGAVFTLYTDNNNAPGDPVALTVANPNSCTTSGAGADAGKCSITNIALGTYWVVETTTPSGYATAPPQKVTLAAGETVSLTFTDPRLHKVIVIVCHEVTNTFAPSNVTLGGTSKTSLSSAPAFATQQQLCGLNGSSATFGGLGHGNQSVTVDVGSGAH